MKALLNKLLLRQKFLILAGLAGTLVAIPSVLFLAESNKAIDVATLEVQGPGPARQLLAIVHLVQQCRGTLTLLINGSGGSREQLQSQQRDTDRAMAAMAVTLARIGDRSLETAWQSILADWAQMSSRNNQLATLPRVSRLEHSAMIARLLKMNEQLRDHFTLRLDPEPDSYFLIDSLLVRAPVLRETLSQMRFYGSDMLAAGSASEEERIRIASRSDRAIDYYDTIDNELSLSIANNDVLRASALAGLAQENRAIGAAVAHLVQEQLIAPQRRDYRAGDYYQQVSQAIEVQYQLSNAGLDQLDSILARRVDALSATKHRLIGAILLLSLLVVALSHLIIRSVTGPLGLALASARLMSDGAAERIAVVEAIADGKLDGRLSISETPAIDPGPVSHDEVGELLRSIVRMNETQRALDAAFAKMTVALRDNRLALQARDWIKTGFNDLGDLMRGDHETADMANQVLGYLAERVGAQAGAFYLFDDGQGELVLRASYALNRRKQLGERCALGQGLVGQAAYERKVICLSEIPSDYFPILSGLGSAMPRQVTAVPLLHADGLVGVLELATLGDFSDAQLEFLERARDSIAIGFHVNMARRRMQQLLAETQRQARAHELGQGRTSQDA
jgi:hypothetical protein